MTFMTQRDTEREEGIKYAQMLETYKHFFIALVKTRGVLS